MQTVSGTTLLPDKCLTSCESQNEFKSQLLVRMRQLVCLYLFDLSCVACFLSLDFLLWLILPQNAALVLYRLDVTLDDRPEIIIIIIIHGRVGA